MEALEHITQPFHLFSAQADAGYTRRRHGGGDALLCVSTLAFFHYSVALQVMDHGCLYIVDFQVADRRSFFVLWIIRLWVAADCKSLTVFYTSGVELCQPVMALASVHNGATFTRLMLPPELFLDSLDGFL